MTSSYESRLFSLLEEAATWPQEQWQTRAEAACADGPVAATALLAALRRSDRLEAFLEIPAWEGHTAFDGLDSTAQNSTAQNSTALDKTAKAESPWKIGDRIGRYRLQEPLGQGGMGEVFLAEQEEPYRRVALKLIRADAISHATLDRFRAEQRALARLNHPHVAQLHEADVTPEGHPFFAMEWVDGLPIHKFFEERQPDLDERLRVFLDVCAAVRHAHQKQVVHRDLKPSNILVAEDESPVVKVIDFGIAEAIDRPLGDVRLSGAGRVYGTPEYLSPESFEGDIDTRADVYALGVLLYELVTGELPFRRGEGSAGLQDLVQQIRRGDVVEPSRAIDQPSLPWAQRLRGDFDGIVRKAMHPNRDERYDTVADLETDLKRFLSFRPVSARKAGFWHQVRLVLKRRRGTALAAALVLFSLTAGTLGATLGLLQAQREAEEARLALEASEELSQFLADLFNEADPNQAQGAEPTARELLDQGAERLRDRLQDQPLTRARLTRTIGDIYAKLGHHEDADPLLVESLQLFREHYGDSDPEVARALHGIAVLKTKARDNDSAQKYFEQALAIQEEHPGQESQAALSLYHLGVLAVIQKDWERAQSLFQRACGSLEEVALEDEFRARCLHAYGEVHFQQKNYDESERLIQESIQLRERLQGPNHPHVASSYRSLCLNNRKILRLEKAEVACSRTLTIRRQVYGENDYRVRTSTEDLAVVMRLRKRYDEAERLFHLYEQSLALEIAEGKTEKTRFHAVAWNRLAWTSWLQGEYSEAEERYRRAYAISGNSLRPGNSSPAISVLGIGLSHWKQGRLDSAEDHLLEAHNFFQENDGPDSSNLGWTTWGLAGVYRDRRDPTKNDLERAQELYEQSLRIRRQRYLEGHEYRVINEEDYQEFLRILDETRDEIKS